MRYLFILAAMITVSCATADLAEMREEKFACGTNAPMFLMNVPNILENHGFQVDSTNEDIPAVYATKFMSDTGLDKLNIIVKYDSAGQSVSMLTKGYVNVEGEYRDEYYTSEVYRDEMKSGFFGAMLNIRNSCQNAKFPNRP